MKYNAKCSICGKPYNKCNDCSNTEFKPWLSVVDDANHYKIFLIISDYNNKKISKENAKELLQRCDLTNYKEFVPEIVNAIDGITKEPKMKKKYSSKEEIEIVPVEETSNE